MTAEPVFPDSDPRTEASLPTMRPGSVRDAVGRIDQYDILRKLGGGGFGVVYLARDTVSGVDVALKTLHPLLKTNAEEMDLLREKFALVSRLAHPNIASPLVLHPCQRIEIWDDEARRELRLSPRDSVMVMRYAPGVTLSRWRRQFPGGVVPQPIALEVARQIASALDYAHSERIVHRDVKPSNVMIETVAAEPRPLDHGHGAARYQGAPQRGGGLQTAASAAPSLRVRILDFGLAAEIRSSMSRVSMETGDTSGTRPYMAPEQWLGRKQDGSTDQYALACVVYELLSGAPPFSGVFETGDPTIMMAAVTTAGPDALEDVPDCVNDAISRALAKDRAGRFPSCTAFVDALGGLESASPLPNPADKAGWRSPDRQQRPSGVSEADVLRKKLALSRAVKAIPAEDRSDAEFGKIAARAEDELAVAEEACKFGRFAAAAESLAAAQSALDELSSSKSARRAREEAERKAREEAARKAREEAERKAREEAARKAKEEAERRAREEAERKAREEAKRRAREEAERKAREEAERRAREEAERRAREEAERKAREEAARKAREEAELKAREEAERKAREEAERKASGEAERKAREEAELKARKEAERRMALDIRPGELMTAEIAPGVTMNFRWCPATTSEYWKFISGGKDFFLMGSLENEIDRSDDEIRHQVKLKNGFWMGETQVTQRQWEAIMGANPSYFLGGKNFLGSGGKTSPQRPVDSVSWEDCQKFLWELNARKQNSWRFMLPTEAQWEYACRAGTTGAYGGRGHIDDMGWYDRNSGNKTHPVAQKTPNAWGLYDMHGNVWEWCADWYGGYPSGTVTDPTGSSSGRTRVLRGGSYWLGARYCRSASRRKINPVFRDWHVGLRLVAFKGGE